VEACQETDILVKDIINYITHREKQMAP